MRNINLIITLGFFFLITGCGKGIDSTIATSNAEAYRKSLDSAWKDMSIEQQNSYNWAVTNFTLENLIKKYPSITPRKVISREADEYIYLKKKEVAEITAKLAENADRLAQEEKLAGAVDAELAKIVATGININKNSFGWRKEFLFITKNDSQYDISSASWDALLVINGEENSDRYCKIRAYYKIHGGLQHGKSMPYSTEIGFMDCNNWDTLEVINAKSKQFKLKLDLDSVENFGEKKVRPNFPDTRVAYENRIKAAKSDIESAMEAKAALK